MLVNNHMNFSQTSCSQRTFDSFSSVDEKTQSDIKGKIKEINEMFLQIGDKLNYWGVIDSEQFAPLGCLKCGKCMYSFDIFSKYGPAHGKNVYFCGTDINNHAYEFQKRLLEVSHIAEENNLDKRELYTQAMKPVHDEEQWIKENYMKEIQNSKEWRMLGTSLGTRPISLF